MLRICLAIAFGVVFSSVSIAQKEMKDAEKIVDEFSDFERAIKKQADESIGQKRKDSVSRLTAIHKDLIDRKLEKIASRVQELIDKCNNATPAAPPKINKTISNGVSFSRPAHSIDLDRYNESYFIVEGQLENQTDLVVSSVTVHLKRSRIGRPLPDYEWESTIEIKGGVKPKERIVWSFPIPSSKLAARDLPVLSKDEIMEVSLDKSVWLPVPKSGRGDPALMQLLNAPVK